MRALSLVLFVAACSTAPILASEDAGDTSTLDASMTGDATTDAPTDASTDAPRDVVTDASTEADALVICSTPGRFISTGAGGAVRDTTTGLTWQQPQGVTVGFAPHACDARRNPTVAELLAIVVKGCDPTLDHDGFPGAVHITDVYASDGCVNMETGTAKAACSQPMGYAWYAMCVSP